MVSNIGLTGFKSLPEKPIAKELKKVKIEDLFSHGDSGDTVSSVLDKNPITTKGYIARVLRVPQPAVNSVINTMAEQGKAIITKPKVLSITDDNRKRQCVISVCNANYGILSELSEAWEDNILYGNRQKVNAFLKANKPKAKQ